MQLSLLNLDQKNARLRKLARRARGRSLDAYHHQVAACWVLHDHALEGEVLDEIELARGIANERGKDVCEDQILDGIHRLYTGIETVRKAADNGGPVDLDMLKKMHVLVSPEGGDHAGRYRKGDGPGGAYRHDSPPARTISYRMRKLCDAIEEDFPRLHPVRAAAAMHHQFIGVFPFDDLSGRAARLLLNYCLQRDGYPAVIIPASARADYYNALCEPGPKAITHLIIEYLEHAMDKAVEATEQALSEPMPEPSGVADAVASP